MHTEPSLNLCQNFFELIGDARRLFGCLLFWMWSGTVPARLACPRCEASQAGGRDPSREMPHLRCQLCSPPTPAESKGTEEATRRPRRPCDKLHRKQRPSASSILGHPTYNTYQITSTQQAQFETELTTEAVAAVAEASGLPPHGTPNKTRHINATSRRMWETACREPGAASSRQQMAHLCKGFGQHVEACCTSDCQDQPHERHCKLPTTTGVYYCGFQGFCQGSRRSTTPAAGVQSPFLAIRWLYGAWKNLSLLPASPR